MRKFIPKGISRSVGDLVLKSKKNSPQILFGAGIAGMVGTVVLASTATLKVGDILDEASENLEKITTAAESYPDKYDAKDAQRDKIIVFTQAAIAITKLYAPAIAVGVFSVACLTKSQNILNKRNAGLTAAYAALDKSFKEYRERVADAVGEEKESEIWRETTEVRVHDENDDLIKVKKHSGVGGSPYAVCFDESNINWQHGPQYNQIFLQCKQSYANDLLNSRGHVFLNEVYDMLGFEHTPAGAVVGWRLGNGDDFIDFGVFSGNIHEGIRFAQGNERSVWLDFNVDGVIYDKI